MRRLVVVLALLAGCADDGQSCVDAACTAELRVASVYVVNASGQPVEGLTTRTVFVATGEVMTPFVGIGPNGGGYYWFLDDATGAQDLADEDGELFRFEITSLPMPFSQELLVKSTRCHCHIDTSMTPMIVLP